MEMNKTLAIVTRAWFPDHQQLLNELVNDLATDGIDIRYGVMLGSERGRRWNLCEGEWGVRPEIIGSGRSVIIGDKEIASPWGVRKWLREVRPVCLVVHPANEIGCLIACKEGRNMGIPVIGWLVGTRDRCDGLIDCLRRSLSGILHRNFCKHIDYAFCYGTKAVGDALKVGLHKPAQVVNVHQCIDEGRYMLKDKREWELRRTRWRYAQSSPDGYHFGYIGQLIRRKGLDLLLKAFAGISRTNAMVHLNIVGRGAMQGALRKFTVAYPGRVRCYESLGADELLDFFCGMDCMVVPSRFDDWSLIVNESICALTDVIASTGVHSSYDLLASDRIFESHSVLALEAAMGASAGRLRDWDRLVDRQRRYRTTWSLKHSSSIWCSNIRNIINNGVFRNAMGIKLAE